MRSNVDDILSRVAGYYDDDEDPYQQLPNNRYNPVAPSHTGNSLAQIGDFLLANQVNNINFAKNQDNYRLSSQKMEYEYNDKDKEREHEENMAKIKQMPTMKELEMQQEAQRFEQSMQRKQQATEQHNTDRLFQKELMKSGGEILRARQELFRSFGFTREDALSPNVPRMSDPVQLLSQMNSGSYLYSQLITGVARLKEDKFDPEVEFRDGTVMALPSGHDGYSLHYSKRGTNILIMHVHQYSKQYIRKKNPGKYLKSILCPKSCDVQ